MLMDAWAWFPKIPKHYLAVVNQPKTSLKRAKIPLNINYEKLLYLKKEKIEDNYYYSLYLCIITVLTFESKSDSKEIFFEFPLFSKYSTQNLIKLIS